MDNLKNLKGYNEFVNEASNTNTKIEYSQLVSAINNDNISELKKILPLIKEQKMLDDGLSSAAHVGKLDILKMIQKAGGDIHSDEDKALRWASFSGHLPVVKYLVENGANKETNNNYPLRMSVQYDRYDTAKYLIEEGCIVKDDFLKKTVQSIKTFRLLVENGAKVENVLKDILSECSNIKTGDEVLKYIVDDLEIKIKDQDLPNISSNISTEFTKWVIFGGIKPDKFFGIDTIKKYLSTYDFQHEFIQRKHGRIGEITEILDPKIREENPNLLGTHEWGMI